MAEAFILPLIFEEAAVGAGLFGGFEAAAGVGAGELLGGFGAAEAGFGFGAGEAAFGAGAEFGLGEAGLGAVGSGGFELGTGGALEALGGFGFEAPVATEAIADAGLGELASGAATDAAAQGGFVPASFSENLTTEAISALNEPSLASPEFSLASDTTDLGSVASEAGRGGEEFLTGPSDIAAPSAEAAQPPLDPSSVQEGGGMGTQVGDQQLKMPGEQPGGLPAQQAGGAPARQAAAAATSGGAGKFNANPMSLMQLANMFGGKPSSPFLGQGGGYAGSLGAFGQGQLDQYKSGQLRPEDMVTIMQQQQGALNKMRQFYHQSGNFSSTSRIQAENQIMQQSVGLQKQFFDQYLNSGMTALGQASNALINAARVDLQSQQSYNDSQSRAMTAASKAFSFSGEMGGNNQQMAA